ncbi:hypothetical protein C8Q79DRAFT_930384 [Trametes meyenii]|nr:hypothetical protein C8Q79DRAFT_930384 [Trametes meyenii]
MTHDTPPRPRDGPWYVTLGKKNARKLQTMTFSQGGRYADPFPIIFKLPSEELADEVLTYRDAIKLIERADKMVDRVRLAYTLPVGDTILENQGLYVVAYGNQSGVFYDHQDAVSAAKGVPTAIWKKVPDFRRAIAYMVSGGQSEKPVDTDVKDELNRLLTQYIASRSSPVSYSSLEGGLATPPRSHFAGALPVSPSPCRAPTQSAILSPLRSSRAHAASGVPRASSPSPQVYSPLGPPRSPAPPSSSPLRSLTPLLAEAIFDISLVEARVDVDVLYQHTRNLRGIKGTHAYPQVDVTKVLSCGRSLDMYLQAQGTSETMEDCVRSLMTHGLPVLEAKYMWLLYEADPPTYAWAENHPGGPLYVLSLSPHPVSCMALFGKGRRLAARQEAASAQRKYVTRLQRKPYRERRKVISIPKTPAERKLLADIQAEKREKLVDALTSAHETLSGAARQMQEEFGGHNQKYYEQKILQLARLKGSKRKANPWNAYLCHELQKRNKALPVGAPRISSSNKDVVGEIAAQWKSMGSEEKERVAETLVQELEELREMKALSLQTVPISSFHDVRGGMSKMFKDARQQYARTGYNLIIIGCKTSRDQISPPMTFTTSQTASDFFPMTLGTTLDDLVSSFEAYSLSGVPSLVGRTIDVIQGLQSHASGLIIQKLGDITEHTAHKMFYVGFGDHITDKFGVVIDNWPLPRFTSPSNLRTRIELTTLINSWETGVTRFRKLTRGEWDRWQVQKNAPEGSPEGLDFIRAVSLASNLTPAAPQDVISAADSTVSAGTTSSVTPETALTLPASKPRKRWSDFGSSRKKRKGPAADAATETRDDTEALATPRPALTTATSHTAASTPPLAATLEPTALSAGPVPATVIPAPAVVSASEVSASSTVGAPGTGSTSATTVSAPAVAPARAPVRASTTGCASTIACATVPPACATVPPAGATVPIASATVPIVGATVPIAGATVPPAGMTIPIASATAPISTPATAPMPAASVPQARPSVFNLPAFSFAPEPPLRSPGVLGHNPAVYPFLGVVPHEWHMIPDCMIDPALREDTPAGLDISAPHVDTFAHAAETTTFIQYNQESDGSCGRRGKRGAGRARARGRGGRGRGGPNTPVS